MNHVIMANHMISLITSSTTDPNVYHSGAHEFRKISNFNQFKNILKSWNRNVCKCSVCADF